MIINIERDALTLNVGTKRANPNPERGRTEREP